MHGGAQEPELWSVAVMGFLVASTRRVGEGSLPAIYKGQAQCMFNWTHTDVSWEFGLQRE